WQHETLEAASYRIAFRAFLEPAAKALREAAQFSDDAAFAKFLQLRADALLSDDYFASDLAWLELKNPKFDIIFAPYETYMDGLLGVKGSYGAAVMARNESESKKLELFQKYVPEIQDALPLAAKVSGEGYLVTTIMHETCHGLGPAFARTSSDKSASDKSAGKVDIREAIGPGFSGLEEAKADVTGMFALKWLVDHDALPKEKLEEYYASYVGGVFRTVRFGTAEAHGQAEMMEFNYISERGAIRRNGNGR